MTFIKNELLIGDCKDVLGYFPDDCIDLTVTSPPYDQLRDYKGYSFDYKGIISELFRVTKPGGIVVWVIGDATVDGSETGTSFEHALYFKEVGFNIHDTMIYNKKSAPFPSKNRYSQVFEYMFVFSKGTPITANIIKDRKNKWGGTSTFGKASHRQKDGSLKEEPAKRLVKEFGSRFNIWEIDCGKGKSTQDEVAYKHPAIFPESLARDHILTWSNPGDVVLDPMCGSGTTCKMAAETGRYYIGIDMSEEYIDIVWERLRSINEGKI
ncbi:MAG: site-specific DNA-methyltransferase [Thermoproteota archaeon]|nr:MAG: site-specific DNA-methyltransferase [Candidatus Korarchaeota archaeon]